MNKPIHILFFGSTNDSVIVLNTLSTVNRELFTISAVVTQPPRPVGRKQILTPTPVEIWAKEHNIAVLSFPSNPEKPWLYANETQVIDALEPIDADIIISASYGQKIPAKTLADATFGGLNVHPSILPRWRGGDPVPWAILTGDHQIGVTVVSLSEKFDEGIIYAQKKIPIKPDDTSTPLRTKLFGMGAQLLVDLLPAYVQGKAKGTPQHMSSRAPTLGRGDPNGIASSPAMPDPRNDIPRATRLSREIGYEPWDTILKAFTDQQEAARIERKYRALHPWPGVWTIIASRQNNENDKTTKTTQEKRLKLLNVHLESGALAIDEVQLEGKNPTSWKQFSDAYLAP